MSLSTCLLLLVAFSCIVNVHSKESFDETLEVFQLPNANYLANFSFSFNSEGVIDESGIIFADYFPYQFLKLAKEVPEYTQISMDLVQGRWHEQFMKKATAFSNQQFKVDGFEEREPGLTLEYATRDGKESSDSHEKLFGFLGNIFSMSIFELQNNILHKLDKKFYYAKPYEYFCKENLSYLLKHLKSIQGSSGFSPLISDDMLHKVPYKHLKFEYLNDGNSVRVLFSISMGISHSEKKSTLVSILGLPANAEILRCQVCDSSKLYYSYFPNQKALIYNQGQIDQVNSRQLRTIKIDAFSDITLAPQLLSSERYLTGPHFAKEVTYYHKLESSSDETMLVSFTDFFPRFLKPFVHTIKIMSKGDSGMVQELDFQKFISFEYDGDSNCWLKFSSLPVPPRSQILILLTLKKHLLNFEEYPNDPSRGFNIPHMPIHYQIPTQEKELLIYSRSILIQDLEPDFSMPFNVNAVSNALIGFFQINTYNVIAKPSRLT